MLYTQIIPLLQAQNLIGSSGVISFNLLGVNVHVSTKDVIGGLLQDWFGNWMTVNGFSWQPGPNAQSWPDFILGDGTHLEFKAFDGTASPNFDLANFDAFTRSLLTEPERLDTDHLVFEYFLQTGGVVTINNIWVKKIWEMAGPSDTNILNLQVKQGVPVNIRPKNWRSNSPRITFFGQRLDFVIALDQALQHFYPNRHVNWLTTVQQNYLIRTGQVL